MSAIQTDESEDRFHVQFDSGEVQLMSLEELDDTFQRGLIHENTYVLREGDTEWQTLSAVAGLEDEEPEAEAIAAPSQQAASNSAVYHAPAWPPAPTRSSPVSTASVVAPSLPIASAAPRSFIPVVQDVRPGLVDLDDDMEMAFKPKRRWGVYVAIAAVAATGGVFAVSQLKAPSAEAFNAAAATPAALTATRASVTTASDTKTEPVVKKEEPSSEEAKPAAEAEAKTEDSAEKKDSADKSDRFSDDMKTALLTADKSRTDKRKTTARATSARVSSRKAKGGKAGKGSVAAGFKNGGSAHDPLNGKL